MKSPLLRVNLAIADVLNESRLAEQSWLLSGASTYLDLTIFCFIPPGATKHPNLGVICEDVLPQDGNRFDLELGVNLPDLFPSLESSPEYAVEVLLPDRGTRTLCFSNVMARLRFDKDGSPMHALVPRRSIPSVRVGEVEFIPRDASVELLRTFASSRYVIDGATAEEALESHLAENIHDFIERLNRVLKVLPFADPHGGLIYSVAYSPTTFDGFYFVLRGRSDTPFGHGRVTAHAGRTILWPPILSSEYVSILRRYLDGSLATDDIEGLLHSARVFLDGGVTEYVLLLSVIAAEVATQRFVHKRLLAAGASKKRLNDLEKDLTYGLSLNLILYAVIPKDKTPDPHLMGKMNRARQLRNEYMHNGLRPTDEKEIAGIYQSTKEYVGYLREVEACMDEADAGKPESASPSQSQVKED